MVTLSNFPNIQDAAIAKGMLETHGIPCVISDQNNLYVPIFGGVSLLVPEEDIDEARRLLFDHKDEQNSD